MPATVSLDSLKNCAFFTQAPGEEIRLLLHRHWFTNLGWLCLTLILFPLPWGFVKLAPFLSLPPLPSAYWQFLLIIYYLLVFAFCFENFLFWYYNVLLVTNKRVLDIDFFGLFSVQSSEAQLEEIQEVSHTQGGLWQLLFNFGHVLVQTAAEKQSIEMHAVPNPGRVHEIIVELMQEGNHH